MKSPFTLILPMVDFSVVCCISKPEIFDQCLLKSVYTQRGNLNVEIIPIINNTNLYSASLALNVGLNVSRSNNVILAHQDVMLLDGWFERLARYIEQAEKWAIIGAAGISLDFSRADIGKWGGALYRDTVAVGTVWNDDDLEVPPYWDGIKPLTRVHCVDECVFVLNKSANLRFDPHFNGFHFYGSDICLQARFAGYNVYAADLPIIHFGRYSASMLGESRYWYFMRLLHAKWCKSFPEFLGTHMHWAKDGLTSYIPSSLEAQDGTQITIKSMGIKEARLSTDKDRSVE